MDRAYAAVDDLRRRAERMSAEIFAQTKGGTHQDRSLRDLMAEGVVARLESLRIGREALLFGRIDRSDGEKFYIGRFGVPDENFEPLVVDWRAPVAEAFYRATGRNPMGIVRRRHFACRGGRIIAIEDELLGDDTKDRDLVLVGEGALLAALRRPRTGRMLDIVETIQSEQDEIIRAPLAPPVVVQGAPGTGKTAVALHRAAYLLYTHRSKLSENGVLFVGPNPIFLRYVEEVLPSLGEREASFVTPSQLMPSVDVKGLDDPNPRRIKGEARMVKVIRKAVRDHQNPLREDQRFLYGEYLVEITPAMTARLVERVRKNSRTHREGREPLRRLLLEKLFTLYWHSLVADRRASGRVVADEKADFYESVAAHPKFRAALDEMWPSLTPQKLLGELLSSAEALKSAAGGSLDAGEQTLLLRKSKEWTEQDVALLDEAAFRIGWQKKGRARGQRRDDQTDSWFIDQLLDEMQHQMGYRMDEGMRMAVGDRIRLSHEEQPAAPARGGRPLFGHVLVDEAQDLSPMQNRMLTRRCEAGSMTVLGDLGQSTSVWEPKAWDQVLPHLPKNARVVELTINYRTPAEIMQLADRIRQVTSPGLSTPKSVRSGTPPLIEKVPLSDLPEAAERIIRREAEAASEGRVAVIVAKAMRVQAFTWCPEEFRPPLEQDILDQRVAILTVADSKGLEFDSVIVIEPAAVALEAGGLQSLYVAMTRATQRLTLLHSRPLPEVLGPVALSGTDATF